MSNVPPIIVPPVVPPLAQMPSYPIAGVGVVSSNEAPVNVTNAGYLRVNSFSAAVFPDNTAIVAVASQDSSVTSDALIPFDDVYAEIELARRESSRVFVSSCAFDPSTFQPSNVRSAKVIAVDDLEQNITVEIDATIYGLSQYQVLWCVTGVPVGTRFQVESSLNSNQFVCKFYKSQFSDLIVGSRFTYVTFVSPADSVTSPDFTPLPYIEYNGFAIPAVNPQIATNANIFPAPSQPYVYVVCQAPVNGTYQLFFYGMQIGSDQIYLWKQLTFNGENKNPRIQVDGTGNLHIVWESNRCGNKNGNGIYYGVLGPSSRGLINEAFVSAVDKQAMTTNSTSDSIVSIGNPVALDLRPEDEYGTRYGSMWTGYTTGGTVTITDPGTITLGGNPETNEFMAFASLSRDQNNSSFDGKFSQLSYQISFKLNIVTGNPVLSDDTIKSNYVTWKSQFTPVRTGANGVNIYSLDGQQYTISRYSKVDGLMVPIVGAYELNGGSPSAEMPLKHFMLALVPEKVVFQATNIADPTDIQFQIAFTGKCKLLLLVKTSANLSDQSTVMQAFHVVRDFGTIYTGIQNDFKIAVTYAHLHSEEVSERVALDTINSTPQNVRFTGNIIVAVNNIVQAAENFIPAFSDTYYNFDIGLGVPPGGQFPLIMPTAFNSSIYENYSCSMHYSSIAIGPQTVIADPFLTAMSKFDRNVSRMVIKNTVGETSSRTAFDEAFLTQPQYNLSFGLYDNKISLSQVPITFLGRSTCPSIAVDNCNHIHVAYQSNRNGPWQVFYAGTVDQGIPFRFDTQITSPTSNATSPTVAVDQQGRRLVAWQDDRNGQFQIYAARSNRIITCNSYLSVDDVLELATGNEATEYDPYDPYAVDICGVVFTYTNETHSAQTFHFSLAFYCNREMENQSAFISSANSTRGWVVNGVQMNALGAYLTPGQSITVGYYPQASDNLSGQLYYVHINGITNSGSVPWPYVYAYFCPAKQAEQCTVPCVYTNTTGSSKTVNFRLSFYSDQSMTELVAKSDTSDTFGIDRNWVCNNTQFPAYGLVVPNLETASVYYIPNVLPPELYAQQKQAQAPQEADVAYLLCGATYYVKVETNISSVYTEIDSFSFQCPCAGVDAQIWRNDRDSQTWICSGQGLDDTRIADTQSDALFPSAVGSQDGIVYIAWEDYREKDTVNLKQLAPDVFFAVWDANTDTFYSSAQGSYDQRVTPYSATMKTRYYKPLSLIGNFQNPTFFFNTRNDVFRSNCTLFNETVNTPPETDYPIGSGVFTASFFSTITNEDAISCLDIEVVKDDIVDLYVASTAGAPPLPLVNQCFIRLDITGPAGTYAVRLRNENDTNWSDWLSILPEIPDYPPRNQYILRGDGTMRDNFEAFFIRDNEFIVPWVLSAGSGNKTVYAEILTQYGKTPTLTVNILARYDELSYKVEFFTQPDFSVGTPIFNGLPVISTEMLVQPTGQNSSSTAPISNVVSANDVSSIQNAVDTVNTIYIRVTFTNAKALQTLLNLASIQKFSGLFAPGTSPNLSFNVLQQGINAQYGLPLTPVSSGVYSGSFTIDQSDGVYNKDGLACIVVNVPNPATKVFTPEFTPDRLDIYNVNLPALGDFEGPYSLVPQEKPEDIKIRQRANLAARVVKLPEFKTLYKADISCLFTSQACVSGSPVTDQYDNEVTPPPEYTGPLSCSTFNWTCYEAKEPFYYLDGTNLPVWVQYSPPFYIDMSDPRSLSLGFGSASQNTGVLFLIKPGETITVSGGTAAGTPVVFTIPNNSIVIDDTSGFLCGDATAFRNASDMKTFNMGSSTAIIPAGTSGNNQTTITSDVFSVGWYVRTFAEGIPRSILDSRGFMTSNNIFTGQFAFVVSGVGHCYIRECSCDANCV